MTNAGMAMHTINRLEAHFFCSDKAMNHVIVASNAIFLQDPAVSLADDDRLMKILKGKSLGMPITVVGLGYIFFDRVVWQMTVHAQGRSVVAGLLPRIKLGLHNMAIGTRLRIFAEIGKSFAISERGEPHSAKKTDENGQRPSLLSTHMENTAFIRRDKTLPFPAENFRFGKRTDKSLTVDLENFSFT